MIRTRSQRPPSKPCSLVCWIALAGSACGGSNSAQETDDPPDQMAMTTTESTGLVTVTRPENDDDGAHQAVLSAFGEANGQPGMLAELARNGHLAELDADITAAAVRNWEAGAFASGTVDGTQYGVPTSTHGNTPWCVVGHRRTAVQLTRGDGCHATGRRS